jgi:hypothetical protein
MKSEVLTCLGDGEGRLMRNGLWRPMLRALGIALSLCLGTMLCIHFIFAERLHRALFLIVPVLCVGVGIDQYLRYSR